MNEEVELAHNLAILLGIPSVSAMMMSMSASEWAAWVEFLKGDPELLTLLAEREEFRQKLLQIAERKNV